MDDNFSLLKHLNVKVGLTSENDVQAERLHDGGHENWVPYRAWCPVSRPPGTESARHTRSPELQEPQQHQQRRPRGSRVPRYADPTGEVIRTTEKGAPVEYVVYESKIPSVHGVNKQLAERKRREAEAERAAAAAASTAGSVFGPNDDADAKDNERRCRLLDELQRCNMEQAQRRRDEARRDERQRMDRELELRRFAESEEAARREKERQDKLASQLALREAAEQAVLTRRAREQEQRAKEMADADRDYMCFIPGARRSSEPTSARALAQQRIAEENRQMAEERAFRLREERALERQEAQLANERALEAMQRDNELRLRERERNRSTFERYAEEAVQKRQQAREAEDRQRAQSWVIPPFATDDDRAAARRAQQARIDEEVNRRLAEQRRARERAEEERDRLFAEERASQSLLAEERERGQVLAKRMEQQAALREAAERGLRERNARRAAEQEVAPMPVYLADREDGAAKRREAQQKQFSADLQRQIEEKQRRRLDEERREKERDRQYLEQAQRRAKQEEQQRVEKQQAQQAKLQQELERQIARKRGESKAVSASARMQFTVTTAPERRALYRCPVTHELLPASEFDFGISH